MPSDHGPQQPQPWLQGRTVTGPHSPGYWLFETAYRISVAARMAASWFSVVSSEKPSQQTATAARLVQAEQGGPVSAALVSGGSGESPRIACVTSRSSTPTPR